MNPYVLPQSSRRLRDEPIDTATTLVEQFGGRVATSLGEAQAAAYFDGRLRRAGLKVSADGFLAPVWSGWDGVALALWTLLAVALYRWLPFLALALGFVGLAFVVYALLKGQPFLVERRPSQNIIATRALAQKPSKRVVLLAPLDAPRLMPGWVRRVHDRNRAAIGRVTACALVLLLALGGVMLSDYTFRLACWYAQFAPLAYLVFAGGLDVWLWRAPASPGAVNHAGALGALLSCAEELPVVQQTELWIVALGASQSGSGLGDLLRRYPFEPGRTHFVVLESIGSGTLAYLTRTGWPLPLASDSRLLALAASVDANDPLIDAEPRHFRHSPSTLGALRRAGWSAVGVSCLAPDGDAPLRGSSQDMPNALDASVIERTVRLVVGLVRRIDSEE